MLSFLSCTYEDMVRKWDWTVENIPRGGQEPAPQNALFPIPCRILYVVGDLNSALYISHVFDNRTKIVKVVFCHGDHSSLSKISY